MLGRALDNLIGVFSPTAKVNRMAAREILGKIEARSQYAAAKTSPSTGAWNPVGAKVNTIIANSMPTMRERAHQLMRDMPAMATGVDRVVDFMIGDGITLQSRIKDPDTGKLNKTLNQKVEDAFHFWCDEADDAGRLHFNEIQQLAARQECGAEGEYVVIKKRNTTPGRYLPFSLMVVEADSVTGYDATPQPGNEIHQGVEYEPSSGRRVAVHFEDYDRWKKPIRVPADQVIMGFRTLRPVSCAVSPPWPLLS